MSSNVYKWCVVPQCTNTSIKTPNKLFVYVPNKKTMRNKWLTLARRDPTALSLNTSIYFCEDHFDLPNDMDNYMEYHVMGSVSQVRMKPGCIPKKFAWQIDTRKRTADATELPKKQRQELIKESEKDLEERGIIIKHLELGEASSSSSVNQTGKMAMCRICLGKDMQLLDVDEVFINNYKILTNLDLKCNEESVYSCNSCLEALKFCIEFREKCISSDLILKEELKNELKQNMDKDDTDTELLEEEIKIEFDIDNDNKLDAIDILEYEIRGYGDDDKVKIEIEEECHDEERPKKALLRKSTRKKPRKTKGNIAIDSNIDTKESDQQAVEQDLHCGICPKEFKTKDSLKKHLDHHKKDEWCEICSCPLLSVANMLGHRLNHIPETQANCTICDKSFTKSYFLECHYMKIHDMHPESSKQIVCKQCNKHFDTIKKLKAHIYNSHNDIRYSCDHCGLGFMQKWCLAKHVRQKHEQGPALKCELCDFTSPYASNMKNHKLRRHTKERVYCKVCGGPFANKKRLALHKCRVVSTKVCDICGVEAKRMKAHMASHLDIYKYQCDKCPAKFKYRGTFQVHMDKHDEIRRYKCQLCPLSFYSPSVFIKHKRVHTGEKPYVCQICNKGFTGNHNLKLHMRIHGLNLINKKGSEAEGNKITEDSVTEQNSYILKRNKQSD